MRVTVGAAVVACVFGADLVARQPCTSTVVGDLHIEHFQSKTYNKR